ncbi:MAG: winged helix DNA-binding domain-containing protein [Defluviitaleaceae bacterium]|nr:winged helix DNA-binding domain-containing protein [Defluviitaleaceae bacterium]
MTISNQQARYFLLLKHGLIGEHKFQGKQGVMDYVKQTGCIQYDPIDICGRNAELTLHARVKGFTKQTLYDLLYKDRLLLDYPDKNTAIIRTEDWPYFERSRTAARNRAAEHPELKALMEQTIAQAREKGAVSPDDIKLYSDFEWRAYIVWSSGKNLSSSVLEQLYGTGDLIIHHKKGTRKFYDLSEKHIPKSLLTAPDPLPGEPEYLKWRMQRFIGAVGMLRPQLPNTIWNIKAELRNKIFAELLEEGKIAAVTVEGIKSPLYLLTKDLPIMEAAQNPNAHPPRCEFLAPLDCFLWDRKIIKDIFNFDYTWEIYTPAAKRKYGHYVLPILLNDRLIGRIDAATKNIWYESEIKPTAKIKKEIEKCITRLKKFNRR